MQRRAGDGGERDGGRRRRRRRSSSRSGGGGGGGGVVEIPARRRIAIRQCWSGRCVVQSVAAAPASRSLVATTLECGAAQVCVVVL